MAVLQRQNLPVLVRVLTHTGPEYWVKELTEICIRHSRNLYYTVQFANLFLSILMTNEGRILKSVDALHLHFGTTSEVSGLLPSFRVTWNDLAEALTSTKEFTTKIQELKYKAARNGELTVLTHDETFKPLFALIGQNKMAQAMGELHALHTFRGYTGCTFGISPQRSTSDECFRKAVRATFDAYLMAKVRFVFSDSPIRIIKGARACFKSLLAVGEDPLHLAIRLEYCWGGKVCGPSKRIRELHRKFNVPALEIERFWQPEDVLPEPVQWPSVPMKDTRSPTEWISFCKYPFQSDTGYISYVNELAKISADYSDYMQRKNSSGVSAIKILQNGASRKHFEGLQNSSRLRVRLGIKGKRLGVGTTRNEQLHRELKSWMRNIYQCHVDRLKTGFRLFLFTKLITHSSAAYSPTLQQKSQQRLLSIIAGKLRSSSTFLQIPTIPIQNVLATHITRKRLHETSVKVHASSTNARKLKKKNNSLCWEKNDIKMRNSQGTDTNIFKRRRTK